MEQTPFELTPEQKGMLASLLSETGQPASRLLPVIAHTLEELQEQEHIDLHRNVPDASPPTQQSPSVLDIFREAREGIPEETWKALPEDLAAQHDHYLYGTPKRRL